MICLEQLGSGVADCQDKISVTGSSYLDSFDGNWISDAYQLFSRPCLIFRKAGTQSA
jgi:hypothetical protein